MFLKEIGSLGWTLLAGGASVMAAGGYGVVNFLGTGIKSEEKVKTLRNIYESDVRDNSKISSAQYISKNEGGDEKSICGTWVSGKSTLSGTQECEKLVREKWGDNPQNQPIVWFEANQESIKEAISSYFDNGKTFFTEIEETEMGWKYGNLSCTKVIPVEVGKNIQVNCNYSSDS
ncbi:hypothetical protein [Mycoplasma suis]|uniref:Uncharacterized protein n=1 Tax=Mycoplasma suis (strain Illinois) TaxID=768700 RepID=F0QQJ8_MYCSL|nr:hypothetical protein [Mycoplasma suis]ADX97768.1 hypothetical protein MSU_0224 [Mycoplasma suis str. Illinois]